MASNPKFDFNLFVNRVGISAASLRKAIQRGDINGVRNEYLIYDQKLRQYIGGFPKGRSTVNHPLCDSLENGDPTALYHAPSIQEYLASMPDDISYEDLSDITGILYLSIKSAKRDGRLNSYRPGRVVMDHEMISWLQNFNAVESNLNEQGVKSLIVSIKQELYPNTQEVEENTQEAQETEDAQESLVDTVERITGIKTPTDTLFVEKNVPFGFFALRHFMLDQHERLLPIEDAHEDNEQWKTHIQEAIAELVEQFRERTSEIEEQVKNLADQLTETDTEDLVTKTDFNTNMGQFRDQVSDMLGIHNNRLTEQLSGLKEFIEKTESNYGDLYNRIRALENKGTLYGNIFRKS